MHAQFSGTQFSHLSAACTRFLCLSIVLDFLQHFRDGLHEQVRVHDVRGMAFGVLGFSLVVLAAIGNMTLAAIPIIYANVHFCAAVFTEKQAGQRVDFPVPVGAFDGCVFQNPLYGFKIAAADNRLMHIFCDVPLAPVYIVVMFIPEMLCSLEVDYIAAILLPCEDIGQGGFVPLAAVILVERLIFTGSPPPVFHVESGGWDLLLCQIYGDLVAVLPADKQTENQADNLGGFLVDYPKILVVQVFDMSFVAPRMERQSERWGPRDRPETGRGALYKRAADLVATYEELLLVPDEACVTHYLGDLGIHIFKYDAAQEQIQNAYEKALSVMEMDDAEFQAEKQFVYRGEIISAMRDRLLVGELKPGETVLFVGTEPYGGPGDFELRGGVVEAVNPSERTCSVRGEFFTMHDVPLHYVLGRYDTSVEGEHYGFPHVRPLFGENRDLAGQYLREAEASWNVQQAETQIDAPQMM